MPKLWELSQLAAQLESTEGTEPDALAAGDAKFLVRNLQFKIGMPNFKRSSRASTFSKFVSIPGARMGTLSFEMDLYGNIASATAPAWGILMQACGLKATAASTTWVYTPSSVWDPTTMGSSDHKSLNMAFYTDGRVREIGGARGKMTIRGKVGEPLVGVFEFVGALTSDPSDSALLSSITYDTNSTVPPIFAGAALSLGGLSAAEAVVDTFELDTGNTVTMRPDANAATGYRSAAITNREARFRFDPEATTTSEHDFYGLWKAGTTGALALSVGSSHNKIAIAAPVVQYEDLTEADRGGILVYQMDCALQRSSGDDEFSITLGV